MSVASSAVRLLLCLLWLQLLQSRTNAFVGVASGQRNGQHLREGAAPQHSPFAEHNSATCCLSMSSGGDSMPLTKLLQQLDREGIRYPPSASRADLEKLLSLNQQEDESSQVLQGPSLDSTQVLATTSNVRKSGKQTDSMNTNQRPLTLILARLDIHNIRYEPSASRAELEALLKKYEQKEAAQPPNSEKKEQQQSNDIPLKGFLAQLDEKQIHYSPSASRKELKELLSEVDRDGGTKRQPATGRTPQESRTSKSQVSMSLRQLLAKLDEKQIRYPPSASRQELEQLLLKSAKAVAPNRPISSKVTPPRAEAASSAQGPAPGSATRKVPIRKILVELDQRRIRYAPSASRSELEALLKESNIRNRKRRERKEQSSLKDLPLPARQTFEALRPGLSDLARKAAREVKYLSRNVRDYLAEDEDGVREPQWTKEKVIREEERSKNEPIDVEIVPLRSRRSPPSSSRPRSKASGGPTPQQRRKPVEKQLSTPLRSKREPSMTRIPYELPSLDVESPPGSTERKARASEKMQEEAPPSTGRRKVYNPYGTEIIDTRDAFDRFGDAFADAAESVLWGPMEEYDDYDDVPSATKRQFKKKKTSQAKYWKDRMEEQVDFFMGIHDDDSTYTNWENEVGDSRQRSVRGKANNSTSHKRRSSKRVPIWEEEGSLVSLLFGRRASGGQLKLERFFENNEVGTNVVTKLIGSLCNGGLLVASYLCRWASVRGAIPQPVVVMAVASTAVSARAGKRFNMVLVTLLVLRTLGELIHGYVRGDQDWEDSNEYEFAREGPSSEHLEDDIDMDGDDL